MPDTSQYKVGVVLSVETKAVSGKKPLKICSVGVGSDAPITVVTSASNVRDGSRCVYYYWICGMEVGMGRLRMKSMRNGAVHKDEPAVHRRCMHHDALMRCTCNNQLQERENTC